MHPKLSQISKMSLYYTELFVGNYVIVLEAWEIQEGYDEILMHWNSAGLEAARLLRRGVSQSEVARRGGSAPPIGESLG